MTNGFGPGSHPGRRLSAAAALVLAGALAGGLGAHALLSANAPPTTTGNGAQGVPVRPGQPAGGRTVAIGRGPANAASIAGKVGPALVDINTTVGYQDAQAAGTGMVLTPTGEVLTNNHVISGATSISVTDVGNGKTYPATVVGYDKRDDIAVLALRGAGGLASVQIASGGARVGDGVVGIGNAGGSGGPPSYAAGVVTATGQTITASDSSDGTSEELTGLLETNANIVAGDSGGPLANTQGQVVGMDTAASAHYRLSQTSQGFAIPISDALQIAHQIETGHATSRIHVGPTAMLGVGVRPDNAAGSGPSGFDGAGQGALVVQVFAPGPAAAAGISAGDTITSAAGHAIASAGGLSAVILQQQPGDTIRVRYVDQTGATHTTTVHLASGPPQ